MLLKEFIDLLQAKSRKIEDLMRRQMPVIAGQLAVSHFKSNFRQSGFVNGGLQPWQPSQRIGKIKRIGKKKDDKTLLSGRDHLYNSLHYIPGDSCVIVQNKAPYAAIHNEGGIVQSRPTVTPRMRKFAWAKYYQALGGQKPGANATIPEDAARWRRLALTKKTKLNIRAVIPKRQFLGESEELNLKIARKLEDRITKILDI